MRSAIGKSCKAALKRQRGMHARTRSRRSLAGSAALLVILTLGGATVCTSSAAASLHNESMKNAELILPLSSAGQKLYDGIWARLWMPVSGEPL
jgi:hypothetical protein